MPDLSTPIVESFFKELGAVSFFSKHWPQLADQFNIHKQEIYGLLRGFCVSEVLMPLWYDPI